MKKKRFVPPTVEQVRKYCEENGYNVDAEEFVKYYSASDPPWYDQNGKPVKSWKQKIIAVWSKPRTKQKLPPIIGKTCSKQGCLLPAVYRDTSGSYDYYRCARHLPPEVSKIYE